ncbi:hypothetical protein chiPu_0016913 [Chiloscyllium punctatum]|uniref:Reverse transcriptase domain-containing protein n=1 Tax=Chiloscyllium punctatum TaxID=137246 RepID=A0A401T6X5_CHIPU|nr:hypothetical protein [Chiloscyllium punctatum]
MSALIQYGDELLVASLGEESDHSDVVLLLNDLKRLGYVISPEKSQFYNARWVEAYPTSNAAAKAVVNIIIKEIMAPLSLGSANNFTVLITHRRQGSWSMIELTLSRGLIVAGISAQQGTVYPRDPEQPDTVYRL